MSSSTQPFAVQVSMADWHSGSQGSGSGSGNNDMGSGSGPPGSGSGSGSGSGASGSGPGDTPPPSCDWLEFMERLGYYKADNYPEGPMIHIALTVETCLGVKAQLGDRELFIRSQCHHHLSCNFKHLISQVEDGTWLNGPAPTVYDNCVEVVAESYTTECEDTSSGSGSGSGISGSGSGPSGSGSGGNNDGSGP